MKRSLLIVLAMMFSLGAAGVSYADTLSGKIQKIDTAENEITLVSNDERGTDDHRLVWEDSLPDSERLEKANIGDFISVDADYKPLLLHWQVTSIRGPLAGAENAISTNERMIEGEIRSLDIPGNSLVLVSTKADASGKMTEYKVVWDDSNTKVRDRLEKAKVGDSISLSADQNKLTRNWKANSIEGLVEDMVQRDIKTITGEVTSVDPAKNYLVLRAADPSGKMVDRKVVWDDDFKDQDRLESLRVGDRLSVRADQNMVTRNWKVKALGA